MSTPLETSLLSQFGFHAFRPGQVEAINSLLQGRHTLVVMPTGAGKSLVYQFVALQLPGLALVISLYRGKATFNLDEVNLLKW